MSRLLSHDDCILHTIMMPAVLIDHCFYFYVVLVLPVYLSALYCYVIKFCFVLFQLRACGGAAFEELARRKITSASSLRLPERRDLP